MSAFTPSSDYLLINNSEIFGNEYENSGEDEKAMVFYALSVRLENAANGIFRGTSPAVSRSVTRILGRGMITVLVCILLAMVSLPLSPIISAALLLLGAEVVLLAAYAFQAKTGTIILHPVVLLYSMLLTLGLAILVLVSVFLV